ncbi:hypothetical protein D9M68_932310 [compost metagenome]
MPRPASTPTPAPTAPPAAAPFPAPSAASLSPSPSRAPNGPWRCPSCQFSVLLETMLMSDDAMPAASRSDTASIASMWLSKIRVTVAIISHSYFRNQGLPEAAGLTTPL